jgi:hypothetical protein
VAVRVYLSTASVSVPSRTTNEPASWAAMGATNAASAPAINTVFGS